MRKKKILCTLGPASMNEKVIQRLGRLGVDIFRLNLSHTELSDLESQIALIRRYTQQPICLDTEGAQIRTGRLGPKQVFLKLNSVVRFVRKPIVGHVQEMNLYPLEVYDQLEKGDILYLDFNSVMVQITQVSYESIMAQVLVEGIVGQNKAVVIKRPIRLPSLTTKDRQAIEVGLSLGVQHIALSFAGRAEDVDGLRDLVGPGIDIISKIEGISGVKNLSEIVVRSQAILIDRGDLGRELRTEALPFAQKAIIRQSNRIGVPAYVATNLLESMVTSPYPTRAEVNDVMNTLLDGADGLVLAAETAIGGYPVECVSMIDKLIQYYERPRPLISLALECEHLMKSSAEWKAVISEDFGRVKTSEKWRGRLNGKLQLMVEDRVIMDADQIALGVFAPLDGFMTQHILASVLDDYRLPNGEVWTLPVLLQVGAETARRFKPGNEVVLTRQTDGQDYAVLTVADIFTQDLRQLAQKWFGTCDTKHPGVQRLLKGGEYFLGGPVNLLRRKRTQHSQYEFMPTQTRELFENRRWDVVVGFHTRNVPHRAHEKLLKLSLEKFGADGLFISPVVGPKKAGDYESDIVLKSYELLIERQYLLGERVLLGVFSSYPRYSGPREAVFTALCRRNFGCTHFVVGRDHAGVHKFYKPEESQALFAALGDVGIKPLFFGDLSYCQQCNDYIEECEHVMTGSSGSQSLSGTQARTYLSQREAPPTWMMRPEVSSFILQEMSRGARVFSE